MNVDEMLQGARDALRAQTVYGEAVERDGLTVIPAATVRGGGGGGGDCEHNGGDGFGLQARPSGAFVVHDGTVDWRPAIDVDRLLRAALAAVAGVLALRLLVSRR
jgi:uncharacterized spore protein YtfJ